MCSAIQDAACAIRRVVTSREGLPGPDVWLVPRRRPESDGLKVFFLYAPGPTLRRPSLANSAFRSPQLFGLLRSKGVTTRLTNGLGLPEPGTFAVYHAPPQSQGNRILI